MSSMRRVSSFSTSKVLGNPLFSQLSQGLSQDDGKKTVMYFVLPPGETENSVKNKNIGEMYKAAEAHFLNIKWLEDHTCHEQELEGDGNVFIFDPFNSPGFQRWEEKLHSSIFRVEILGPQVLRYVFNAPDVLSFETKSFPTYTLAMRNMIISLSGFHEKDKETKEELERLIRFMNGTVSSSLTRAVTHVVTAKALTKKCMEANKQQLPLMTADWVRSAWKDNQTNAVDASDKRYVKYICPVFYKMNICMSQISPGRKASLKGAIERLGGKVSPDLVKGKTDILVVNNADGDKFKHAKKWKLTCVTPLWVENSTEKGQLLPVEEYLVEAQFSIITSTPANSMAAPPLFDYTRCSAIMGDLEMTTNIVNESNNLTQTQIEADAEGSVHDNTIAQLRSSRGNGDYLDGCKIYLVDYEKSSELKKLLNTTGAVRHDKLVDGVTHVIVPGSKIPKPVHAKIQQLDPSPFLVTMEWLLQSAKEGKPADEEVYKFGADSEEDVPTPAKEDTFVAPLPPGPSSRLIVSVQPQSSTAFQDPQRSKINIASTSKASNRNPNTPTRNSNVHEETGETAGDSDTYDETEGNQDEEEEDEEEEEEDEDDAEDDEDDEESACSDEEDEEPISNGILNGISFRVMLNDRDEREYCKDIIRGNGGSLKKMFPTVCLLDPVCARRNMNCGEKAHTKFWLCDCIEIHSLDVDRSFHHYPLPSFKNMKDILPDTVIAVSQYNSGEREYITYVVEALGGIYQEAFSRRETGENKRSTHLICKGMDSQKAKAGKKWGVPVVIVDWILETFNSRQKADEDVYDPAIQPSSTDDRTIFMPTPKKEKQRRQTLKNRRNSSKPQNTSTTSVYPGSEQKNGPSRFVRKDKEKSPPVQVQAPVAGAVSAQESFQTPPRAQPQPQPSTSKMHNSNKIPSSTDDPQQAGTSNATRAPNNDKNNGLCGDYVKSPGFLAFEKRIANLKAQFPYTDEEYQEMRNLALEECGGNLDNISPFSSFEERRLMDPNPTSPLVLGLPRHESRMMKEEFEMAINGSPQYPLIKLKRTDTTPMSEIAKRFGEWQRKHCPSPIIPAERRSSNGNGSTPPGTSSVSPRTAIASTPKSDGKELRRRAAANRFSQGNAVPSLINFREDEDEDEPEVVDPPTSTPLGISKLGGAKRPSDGSPEDEKEKKRSRRNSSPDLESRDESDLVAAEEMSSTSAERKSVSPNENIAPYGTSSEASSNSKKTSKRMQALTDLINESEPAHPESTSPVKRQSGEAPQVMEEVVQEDEEMERPHLSLMGNDLGEEESDTESKSTVKKAPNKVRRLPEPMESIPEPTRKRGGTRRTADVEPPPNGRVTRRTRSQSKPPGEDRAPLGHKPIIPQEEIPAPKAQKKKASVKGKRRTFPIELPVSPVLVLSSLTTEVREAFSQYITELGGRQSTKATFDPDCDGMVTGSLIRSEKILGCIAAGKLMLTPKYIEDSKKHGRFLPVTEEYVWNEGNINQEKERELARASFNWLKVQLADTNCKPMKGMVFFILETSKDKEAAYRRLVAAAGGEVVSRPQDAGIIIKDDKSTLQAPPGVEIRNPMYLNTVILTDPEKLVRT